MAELNHENQVEQDAPPLLEVIVEELGDIKEKWREVGEVLKVSTTKLDDIQERGLNDKDNLKIVLKEWMDKNMSMLMWSPLLQALNNSTIDMNPSRIEQLRETYCNRAELEGEYKINHSCDGSYFAYTSIDLAIRIYNWESTLFCEKLAEVRT